MPRTSAGLVMLNPKGELLLVHPGGPFFRKRDAGVWSVPKGLCEPGEDAFEAAKREFAEELGFTPRAAEYFSLGTVRQSNKVVQAWAFRGDWDPAALSSNEFELEWPPRSGKLARFPEVDRAEFFPLERALEKVIAAQRPLLERAFAWAKPG